MSRVTLINKIDRVDNQPAAKVKTKEKLLQTARAVDSERLIDGQGRQVTYLRLSVTDRCDLRCQYCMPERMTFLPKSKLLTYSELEKISENFIRRGVDKIRVTGGEPLVRRDIIPFLEQLGKHVSIGSLGEIALTTNGTQLEGYAEKLAAAGLRRINVSLDHLNPDKFHKITRGGNVNRVLNGIKAAKAAGLHIKINTVALNKFNLDHIETMMSWAHSEGHDLTVIEAMPLGEAGSDRDQVFADLRSVKEMLSARYTLTTSSFTTGGPSRYYDVEETGGRIGFISPLSDHFCATCNRVRLTCTGQLFTCLGHDNGVDLRSIIRSGGNLDAAIDEALLKKPKRHGFDIDNPGALVSKRHMSMTGG